MSLWILYTYCAVTSIALHDDLMIAEQCWRASEWNDILSNNRLNKSHVIRNAVTNEYVDYIMNKTMKYVAENGWSTDRHVDNTATTDIDTKNVPGLNTSIIETTNAFYAYFSEHYDIPTEFLRIFETFVVKYEYKKGLQSSLIPHVDASDYSFVLALNHPNEYDGGGTRFTHVADEVVKLNKGDMVIFPGKLEHEGVAITNGKRLILAGFLRIIPNSNGKECDEIMQELDIVITNHLNVAVELFWYDESIATIEPGAWIEIFESHHGHHLECNYNLCDIEVDFRKRYYDIWPKL